MRVVTCYLLYVEQSLSDSQMGHFLSGGRWVLFCFQPDSHSEYIRTISGLCPPQFLFCHVPFLPCQFFSSSSTHFLFFFIVNCSWRAQSTVFIIWVCLIFLSFLNVVLIVELELKLSIKSSSILVGAQLALLFD